MQQHPRPVRTAGRRAQQRSPRRDRTTRASARQLPGQQGDAVHHGHQTQRLPTECRQRAACHGPGQARWPASRAQPVATGRRPPGRRQSASGRRRGSARRADQGDRQRAQSGIELPADHEDQCGGPVPGGLQHSRRGVEQSGFPASRQGVHLTGWSLRAVPGADEAEPVQSRSDGPGQPDQ
ncbi:Uncharacterised protein [Mycobacteroides abscessus subsp. massiliense]|nr:Uncharacterised protein [Mycobacteroides abscessus subsp. massiliense]